MFKITVDMRRINSGDDYKVHEFRSYTDDIDETRAWLYREGWEVLNIRSEPYELDDEPYEGDDNLMLSVDYMTYINARGENVEDSPSNTNTRST